MKIRQSTKSNLVSIMQIIADAQSYLANLNIDQWQDGYPTEEQFAIDIKNNDSYIIVDDEDTTIGTAMFSTKGEPTYRQIEGEWLTKKDAVYGVIHRLAVANKYRSSGIAKFVFDYCENELNTNGINSMRIDTHKDNLGMQKILKNRSYHYCGVITLTSGAKRLAYEKLI